MKLLNVINIPSIAGDPASPTNGDVWYNSSTGKFRKRENGSTSDLDTTGSSGTALAPPAGTATVAPLSFTTSGATLKTSPVGGDEEVDSAGIQYYTHASSERGVLDAEQFITLTSTYTLTSQTTVQKLFNSPTNGQVTLASSKTYFFECQFSLSSMSASAGSFGFALGGTAVLGSQAWIALGVKTANLATGGSVLMTYNTAANAIIAGSTTSTNGMATIRGKVRVTTGGTLIPQVSLGVAAAAVVGVDSYFRIWAVGSNTVLSVGNWS